MTVIIYAQNNENPYDRALEPAKSFHEARELVEARRFEDAHVIHKKMFSNIDAYRPKEFLLYVYNLTYDWHCAAKDYPPAMTSLLELRDALEIQLKELRENKIEKDPKIEVRIDLLTVFYFNEWLKEDSRSADLFAVIEKHYPSLANQMYFHCKDALFRAKRYPTIVRYQPDPELIVKLAASTFKVSIDARPDLEAMARGRFEKNIIDLLDVFSAVGDVAKVEELRKRALGFLDSEKIRKHIPTKKANDD